MVIVAFCVREWNGRKKFVMRLTFVQRGAFTACSWGKKGYTSLLVPDSKLTVRRRNCVHDFMKKELC
jgi:hypothetical protein